MNQSPTAKELLAEPLFDGDAAIISEVAKAVSLVRSAINVAKCETGWGGAIIECVDGLVDEIESCLKYDQDDALTEIEGEIG